MAYRLAAATGFRVPTNCGPCAARLLPPDRPRALRRRTGARDEEPPARRAADPAGPRAHAGRLVTPDDRKAPVLPLHHETAKAMRGDLEAAGVPYETDDGVADFHSFAGTSSPRWSGPGRRSARSSALARHAKAETTLKHYAR